MKRKCAECKEDMEINKDNVNDVIKFEASCYHHDCFINACERKSKRRNALPKWGEALVSISKIEKESREFLLNEVYKDEIFEFIKANYDIKVVPNKIFTKLAEIYNGTFRGLTCCIPPEDILDMWKRQMTNLRKIRARNITLGKEMSTVQQINYDISVLIYRYDDYLKWKEKNKAIEQSINEVNNDILQSVDLDKLSKATQNQKNEEEDDIDSLLEELFD